jgi:predicted acylesterase/phospholipase RssA
MTFAERLAPGPQKRLLALDGGGIRGLITIETLAAIEETLRERYPREHWAGSDFRLSDYFDYVAGTSTGAIIATCISLGMSVAEIRGFYRDNGTAMFDKASLLRRFNYKFEDEALAAKLQEVFDGYLPGDERGAGSAEGGPDTHGARKPHITLGSGALRTLLLVVMRNATTDSPWPVSNNPRAKYNDRALAGCNLDLPLWQLVRASTAAPTYFPAEQITLDGQRFLFVDGGVTPYNNPAFLVFLMSTVGAYRLDWDTGPDRMLLVSIGTGVNPNANSELAREDMNLLYNAGTIPSALMLASLNEQDMLCRVFGRCRHGSILDSEVESLVLTADEERRAKLPKLFTYMRYNTELTRGGLDALGLRDIQPAHVQQLDSIAHMDDLARVGQAVARTSVKPSHFDGFV